MEMTDAQKEVLQRLPRKTYTLLPPDQPLPTDQERLINLLVEVSAQAKVHEALGGPTLFKRIQDELVDLYRRLQLALENKPHAECPLCGHKWSIRDYAPVNDRGDCYTCAREQYGH